MHRQIWDNRSLTKIERTQLLDEVANQAIFGVDAGREPVVARIARINMFLHADRVLVGRHRSARRRGAPSERGKREIGVGAGRQQRNSLGAWTAGGRNATLLLLRIHSAVHRPADKRRQLGAERPRRARCHRDGAEH
jgi:hypothetical protein